ncbi:hypothetical protein MLD38_027908 [Melastoma candidum]|uniref:Uncharacterized protein n=1 Tax=Melastoma candidum TaxID=119954 RepID=A0ACB9MZK1_9MYRT|nr:hypothetical protein MLD38_027908 [Melastoma candidum]
MAGESVSVREMKAEIVIVAGGVPFDVENALYCKWIVSHSLWDSYEIVAISKRLETALIFDCYYAGIDELDLGVVEQGRVIRWKRESRNSLRNPVQSHVF